MMMTMMIGELATGGGIGVVILVNIVFFYPRYFLFFLPFLSLFLFVKYPFLFVFSGSLVSCISSMSWSIFCPSPVFFFFFFLLSHHCFQILHFLPSCCRYISSFHKAELFCVCVFVFGRLLQLSRIRRTHTHTNGNNWQAAFRGTCDAEGARTR